MKPRTFFLALLLSAIFVSGAFARTKKGPQTAPAAHNPVSPSKVDINSASEKELDTLPGVGSATAKKIIAGRPYSSVSDLSRAGLKPVAIQKITPLVQVGVPMSANAVKVKPQDGSPKSARLATASTTSGPVTSHGVAGPGMVWVNKDTKVYHRQGDRWYGKTQNGQYMSEADAIKAGYRPPSKPNPAKK